jgi:LmeA-like phospholipid-binding
VPVSAAKALGGLFVLGVVAAGGLYVGDRYAESRAEEYAVGVVSQSISTTSPPVVDIKGFPFLTQLMSGTLDHVTATSPGATLDGVPVTDVAIDATRVNVRPPAGQQPSAGHATVVATIPTASLEKAVKDGTGLTVQLAVDGSTIKASGNVLGLPIVLTLAPRVDSGKLLVDAQDLTLGGRQITPESLPSAVRDRVKDIEVPVQGLPSGLALSRAEVVPSGLRVTADGTNVVVPETTAANGGA